MSADFTVFDHGSIVILNALTEQAQAWVDEHLPEDRLTWGVNGVVIEPRYVDAIIEGIIDAGLDVA